MSAEQYKHSSNKRDEETVATSVMLLVVAMLVEHFHHRCHKYLWWISSTALITLAGIASGGIAVAVGRYDCEGAFSFTESTFQYLVLPPIVLSSGFHTRVSNFKGNVRFLLSFTWGANFTAFLSMSGLIALLSKHVLPDHISLEADKPLVVLLLATLILSSEPAEMVGIINASDEKKEEELFPMYISAMKINPMIKSAFALCLLAMSRNVNSAKSVYLYTVLGVLIAVTLGSLLGLAASAVYKFVNFKKTPHIEVLLFLTFGLGTTYLGTYLNRFMGDFKFPSNVCTYVAGMVMSRYAWYQMSDAGKAIVPIVLKVVSGAGELYTFCILGTAFWAVNPSAYVTDLPKALLLALLALLVQSAIGLLVAVKFNAMLKRRPKKRFQAYDNLITLRQFITYLMGYCMYGHLLYGLAVSAQELFEIRILPFLYPLILLSVVGLSPLFCIWVKYMECHLYIKPTLDQQGLLQAKPENGRYSCPCNICSWLEPKEGAIHRVDYTTYVNRLLSRLSELYIRDHQTRDALPQEGSINILEPVGNQLYTEANDSEASAL